MAVVNLWAWSAIWIVINARRSRSRLRKTVIRAVSDNVSMGLRLAVVNDAQIIIVDIVNNQHSCLLLSKP